MLGDGLAAHGDRDDGDPDDESLTAMRPRRFLLAWPVLAHQGGWDEVLMIFGLPIVAFVFMRWVAGRRSRSNDDEESP